MRLLALLLSLVSISVFGQDYVVTVKGDTIRGETKIMSYDQLDRVRISVTSGKSLYNAREVTLCSSHGDLYKPVQMDRTVRFMKILKAGYLTLYAYRIENQTTYDGRYLAKRDGTGIEVPNLGFKKVLAGYLKECASVRDKIENGDYGKGKLNQLIDDFNTCIENGTFEIKKAVAAVAESKQKAAPLEELLKKVEGLNNLPSKKDAEDLIHDMIAKLKSNQTVPNYQVEALKGFLQGNKETEEDLAKVLATLKQN